MSELADVEWDLTTEDMKGIGVFVCTRGKQRWKQLVSDEKMSLFCEAVQGVIITRHLERFYCNLPLTLDRQPEMPLKYLSLTNGDKGDAAKLLNVPVLLFDDKKTNLDQVRWKGAWGSDGVQVHKGAYLSNYNGEIAVGT